MQLSTELSLRLFEATTKDEIYQWLLAIDKELQGVRWLPVGGNPNNVHTVEVSSDPALALVERPTNGIDALLDLKARVSGETSPTPHLAGVNWWGIPAEGLSAMHQNDRRALADNLQITLFDSGENKSPTVTVQDAGTGQHPDDFEQTLLSLLASNKKSSTHQMGVYNAGGAASYKFAKYTVIASRLAPDLLGERSDEIGVTVVRYNPLDPDKYKTGQYEYLAGKDDSIIRLGLNDLPSLAHGTYVKLIEYPLNRYARSAYGPKGSLWHLFHAALPDPALPFRIIETRPQFLQKGKTSPEKRVVNGLLHLLQNEGVAEYWDDRHIQFGELGSIRLRYFVVNPDRDPDAYTTADQGLTITLNGQRQITRDRQWIKRQLETYHLFKRIVVIVDGTALSSAAKREVFSSTRESGVDSELTRRILERIIDEMKSDDELYALDEQAKQKALAGATKSTSDKIKSRLATQIAATMSGTLTGSKGGGANPNRPKPGPRPGPPRPVDDSDMLDVPTVMELVTNPLKIMPGSTASLFIYLNAKNGFLPKYEDSLTIVIGPEQKSHVRVRSKGKLNGGRVRITIEADSDAAIDSSTIRAVLVNEELGILLTADGLLQVTQPTEQSHHSPNTGGTPNVDVQWIGRESWEEQDPVWDEDTVGDCVLYREDHQNRDSVTKAEFILNSAFRDYEKVVQRKNVSEQSLQNFRESYEFPVLMGLFTQRRSEEENARIADEQGRTPEIPAEYIKGEKARIAVAVLAAIDPILFISTDSEE